MRIRSIPSDNGKKFTDRFFSLPNRGQSGKHEFDVLCAVPDTDQRLSPLMSCQNYGLVQQFNGRIEDVLQGDQFRPGEEFEATLHLYVWLYNQQLSQSTSGSKTPLHAMKDWHKLKSSLFKKQP